MPLTTADRTHMARALHLAERGRYSTAPNPRVGCVLVDPASDQVIAEGWHQQAGGPHAEAAALAAAGDRAAGATAYVTLEPCSHHGRTPPCAEALVAAGVGRVVYAMQDPNPQVAGSGLARLTAAGIAVDGPLLEAQARALNPGFVARMERGRPWVRVKLAASLDGRTAMASGESQWITGPAARGDVQRLRAQSGAVITGAGTVVHDNPRLSVRAEELGLDAEQAALAAAQQPLKVVVDSTLRSPVDARVFADPDQVLLICSRPQREPREALQAAGITVVDLSDPVGRVDLEALLRLLATEHGINEVLVEAGSELAGAFLQARLVDELYLYYAPVLLGSAAKPLFTLPLTELADKVPLTVTDIRALGQDWRVLARPAPR